MKTPFSWDDGRLVTMAHVDGIYLCARILRRQKGRRAPTDPRTYEWSVSWFEGSFPTERKEIRVTGRITGTMEEAQREAEKRFSFVRDLVRHLDAEACR